jgi:hypothetical protein
MTIKMLETVTNNGRRYWKGQTYDLSETDLSGLTGSYVRVGVVETEAMDKPPRDTMMRHVKTK